VTFHPTFCPVCSAFAALRAAVELCQESHSRRHSYGKRLMHPAADSCFRLPQARNPPAQRLATKERVLSANIFKNKLTAAAHARRPRRSCERLPARAELWFERGSFEDSSSRDVWDPIYRSYCAYLSSCIVWPLAVPVASDEHVGPVFALVSDGQHAGVVAHDKTASQEGLPRARTGAHGPRKFMASPACT